MTDETGLMILGPIPDEALSPVKNVRRATREELLASEILAELTRARAKFPGKNVTFAALVEEVGELATATFAESADRVRKEAVQVAVMAMRMILDGDHCFEPWRAEKGLDPLNPALRATPANDLRSENERLREYYEVREEIRKVGVLNMTDEMVERLDAARAAISQNGGAA